MLFSTFILQVILTQKHSDLQEFDFENFVVNIGKMCWGEEAIVLVGLWLDGEDDRYFVGKVSAVHN